MIYISARIPDESYDSMITTPSYKILGKSEFIRQSIAEKCERDNLDFLLKRKKEFKEKLELLEKLEKTILEKKEDKTNLSDKEIIFLLETKKIIDDKPEVVDGRIQKFILEFKKPYKISRADMYSLIDEAETQEIQGNVLEKVSKAKEKKEKKELTDYEREKIEEYKKVLINLENNGFSKRLKNCRNQKAFSKLREELVKLNIKFDISSLMGAKEILIQEKKK